jgi:hypothetical protein
MLHYKASKTASGSRCTPQRRPAKLSHQDIQQHQDHQDRQGRHLALLPPHLSSCRAGAAPERSGLCGHGVGLVDEELDAFAPAEDLFDVFDHDVFDVVELCLGAGDFVDGRGGVVGVHEGGEGGREGRLEAVCGGGAQHGRGRGGEFGELWGSDRTGHVGWGRTLRCRSTRNANGVLLSATVRRVQCGWRRLPSCRVVRHDEVDEAALGDVVKEVLVPDIGEFAVVGGYL